MAVACSVELFALQFLLKWTMENMERVSIIYNLSFSTPAVKWRQDRSCHSNRSQGTNQTNSCP